MGTRRTMEDVLKSNREAVARHRARKKAEAKKAAEAKAAVKTADASDNRASA
jgi:hypothetical protein